MRWAFLASLVLAIATSAATVSSARAEAALTLDPASGPCNGTVTAGGTGFPANVGVLLELGNPDSDTKLIDLATVQTDGAGTFVTSLAFPSVACDVVAPRSDHLTVFADQAGEPYDLEIYTRTDYQIVGEALPSTGYGGSTPSSPRWMLIAGGLMLSSLLLPAVAFRLRTH